MPYSSKLWYSLLLLNAALFSLLVRSNIEASSHKHLVVVSLSHYLAPSCAVNGSTAKCNTLSCD